MDIRQNMNISMEQASLHRDTELFSYLFTLDTETAPEEMGGKSWDSSKASEQTTPPSTSIYITGQCTVAGE